MMRVVCLCLGCALTTSTRVSHIYLTFLAGCRRVVELLVHPALAVKTPALRTVGNVVTGDDLQTQQIIHAGALPCLLTLLTADKKSG